MLGVKLISREILFKTIAEWVRDSESDGSEYETRVLEEESETVVFRYGGKLWTIRDEIELAKVRKQLQLEVNYRLMRNGVDILDVETAYIHPDTAIGKGTVIYPNVVIREDVTVAEMCQIGPFAYIRPGTVIESNCKIGDFVEVKNSSLCSKTKVPHLTYVGDADVGQNVNFGCGSVTVNYDGTEKHRVTIGDNAFIGCNTNLIAPVTVGDNAYTAAGSTITRDVPGNALGVARARQENKEEWVTRRGKNSRDVKGE